MATLPTSQELVSSAPLPPESHHSRREVAGNLKRRREQSCAEVTALPLGAGSQQEFWQWESLAVEGSTVGLKGWLPSLRPHSQSATAAVWLSSSGPSEQLQSYLVFFPLPCTHNKTVTLNLHPSHLSHQILLNLQKTFSVSLKIAMGSTTSRLPTNCN